MEFYHLQGAKDIPGVDTTTVSVKNLKGEYPEYDFVEENICSSSLVSKVDHATFDILNVFDVLYHITDDKWFEEVVSNLCNLTRENGFAFISDSFGEMELNVAKHVKFRSRKFYATVLQKNCAGVVAAYPLYYFLNRPIFGRAKLGFHSIGISLDNLFAPIYHYLDKLFVSPERSNLDLAVAKKVRP